MLKLNNLSSPKGSNKNTKRLGRGLASGQGCQAGKGHKGQKARKSGHVRTGFEGNNLPLYMRLPKRGFKNEPFREEFAIVNLGRLQGLFTSGEQVSRENLIQKGILKGADRRLPLKVLAEGEYTLSLTFVSIDKFSKKAQEIIAANGGKIALKETTKDQ